MVALQTGGHGSLRFGWVEVRPHPWKVLRQKTVGVAAVVQPAEPTTWGCETWSPSKARNHSTDRVLTRAPTPEEDLESCSGMDAVVEAREAAKPYTS